MINNKSFHVQLPVKRCSKQLFIVCTLLTVIGISGKTQDKTLSGILQQFDQSQTNSLPEKIFVHTDKTVYIAGELIWFKLYQTDGYLNEPIDISKLSYIEILSKDQKPVLQAKIAMRSGTGSGSFLLPPSLQSGNYLLRAYTNWMKNFSADHFFEKQITIINSLKRPDWKPGTVSGYDLQFFPEGGNLVEGLQSKVGFRITDHHGKGVHCTGAVINQNNDTVAIVKTVRFGIGNFVFSPQTGHTYKAYITVNKDSFNKELPAVNNRGYVMNVAASENEELKVIVNTNKNALGMPLYLLIHKRQLVKTVMMKPMQNDNVIFVINKKELGDGISNFTLFDGQGLPLCERLFFKQPEKKLKVEIKPDHQEYGTKKQVKIELSTDKDTNRPLPADMSVSVFLLDSLQQLEQNDIFSYLWLDSDLNGNIESPAYYFSNTGKEADEAIDNLMLTHGWRRFNWNDSPAIKKPIFKFLPEYEGHIINGTLINKKTGVPESGTTAFLSIPGERFQFSNTISDEEGHIRFIVKDFLGTEEIIVQTNHKKDSGYRINISSPFSEYFSSAPIPPLDLSENWKNLLVVRSIGAQTQNLYLSDSIRRFLLPQFTDTTSFYGKPDKEYLLDDYTRFVTMEEVMREFVSEVRVRKRQELYHYQVLNAPYNIFFESDPLVLLDGVPVFDIDKMISFDPLKIKKIDVVTQRYYYGLMANYGIVSYKTYEGNLGGFQLDPSSLVVEYEGLQLQREFYSPVYDTDTKTQNRLPDFRNVLYWSPDIAINKQGKAQISFYTSEVPGTYAIVLCGITKDGYAGSSVASFSVINHAKP